MGDVAGLTAGLAVVIAAYNEAESIGAVLAAIPASVCGFPTSVIVVDDGSADATAARARALGAAVISLPANQGQGAALRAGYAEARSAGATLIATVDADGQYDPGELPLVVQPLVDGRADFVTGSRRLGVDIDAVPLRRAGVRLFAAVISALIRTRITDPANGLRAMRAEVTADVPLRQAQYQAAELLIGAALHGYRVVEVPTSMRGRTAGRSKKGPNLLYGLHFARVIVSTWWAAR